MVGLIVILFHVFKLAFLASLACVKTKEFLLKSEDKNAYLHYARHYERGLFEGLKLVHEL